MVRTTLAIDDDVMAAARGMAVAQHKSVGEIISLLARKALQPSRSTEKSRNGVPLLAMAQGGTRVTAELVKQLGEELP